MDSNDNHDDAGEKLTEPAEPKDKKDEFIVVQSRQRKKRGRKGRSGSNYREDIKVLSNPAEREETENRDVVIKKIGSCIKILENSTFYTALLETLDKSLQEVSDSGSEVKNLNILCLGLGIFSSHHLIDLTLSRFQLALLVLLQRRFQTSVEVFDPAFISQERSILSEEFGFRISEENKQGQYYIDQPTLLFLPHCPHQLVNNLLKTNWSPGLLNNSYILSNSLSTIAILNLSISNNENLCFISKAQSVCTEIPISIEFKENPKVFNEMSLHVFLRKNVTSLLD